MNTEKKPSDIILEVEGLKKYFPIRQGVFKKVVGHVKAVNNLNFFIRKGETLGLVGESGCGKTTTGRCINRLHEPTDGIINYNYKGKMVDIMKADNNLLKELRREIQIIFQDPFSSLNSRMTVRDIIADPLIVNNIGNKQKRTELIKEMMDRVKISKYYMNRYPHEFSGGQRQRIGIARSLILNPNLIICDEPVSALDVSIQAQILNLLMDLQEKLNLTYLFIAHDLNVIEYISDRVAVMYLGQIVEMASADELYSHPEHPYTKALLSAIPIADSRSTKKRIPLEGSVPDPSNAPKGCSFQTRCKYAKDICRKKEPELRNIGDDHYAACHLI